jgi:hypothetical protein
MASARKRSSAKQGTKQPGMAPVKIFVRIGALKRFHTMKERTTELPVEVSWDRRRSDRRAAPGSAEDERRANERRQQLPFTWEMADFVVVEEPGPPQKAKSARKPRKA